MDNFKFKNILDVYGFNAIRSKIDAPWEANIGIISNGIRKEDESKFTKIINNNEEINNGEDGSIVLKILKEIVPEANIYFAAASYPDSVISAFEEFKQIDPNMIVCNTLVFNNLGPYKEKDTISYQLRESAKGLLVIQSSGDYGNKHFIISYDRLKKIQGTDNIINDYSFTFSLPPNTTTEIILNWKDANWSHAIHDFNFRIKKKDIQTSEYHTEVESFNVQDGSYGSYPYENVVLSNTDQISHEYILEIISNVSNDKLKNIDLHLYFLNNENNLNIELKYLDNIYNSTSDYSLPNLADIPEFFTVGTVGLIVVDNFKKCLVRNYGSRGPSLFGKRNLDIVFFDGIDIPNEGTKYGNYIPTAFVTAACALIKLISIDYTNEKIRNLISLNTVPQPWPLAERNIKHKQECIYGKGLLDLNNVVNKLNKIITPVDLLSMNEILQQYGFHSLCEKIKNEDINIGIIAEGLSEENKNGVVSFNTYYSSSFKTFDTSVGDITYLIIKSILPNCNIYFVSTDNIDGVSKAFLKFKKIDTNIVVCNTLTFLGEGIATKINNKNYHARTSAKNLLVVQSAGDYGNKHLIINCKDKPLIEFNLSGNTKVKLDFFWEDVSKNLSFEILKKENLLEPGYQSVIRTSEHIIDDMYPYKFLILENNFSEEKIYCLKVLDEDFDGEFHIFYSLYDTGRIIFEDVSTIKDRSLPNLADIPEFLTVGSIDIANSLRAERNKRFRYYSITKYGSKGPSLFNKKELDITFINKIYIPGIGRLQGTNISTAFVTAACALLKIMYPKLSNNEIITVIKKYAIPLPYLECEFDMKYKDVSNYGSGCLDLTEINTAIEIGGDILNYDINKQYSLDNIITQYGYMALREKIINPEILNIGIISDYIDISDISNFEEIFEFDYLNTCKNNNVHILITIFKKLIPEAKFYCVKTNYLVGIEKALQQFKQIDPNMIVCNTLGFSNLEIYNKDIDKEYFEYKIKELIKGLLIIQNSNKEKTSYDELLTVGETSVITDTKNKPMIIGNVSYDVLSPNKINIDGLGVVNNINVSVAFATAACGIIKLIYPELNNIEIKNIIKDSVSTIENKKNVIDLNETFKMIDNEILLPEIFDKNKSPIPSIINAIKYQFKWEYNDFFQEENFEDNLLRLEMDKEIELSQHPFIVINFKENNIGKLKIELIGKNIDIKEEIYNKQCKINNNSRSLLLFLNEVNIEKFSRIYLYSLNNKNLKTTINWVGVHVNEIKN